MPDCLLTILMPCRNEEAALSQSIDDARSFLTRCGISGEILVVDNGSSDRSAAVAAEKGVRIVTEPRPGYGYAIRKGLECAEGSVIIIGDCDTTYDFSCLEKIYGPLAAGECDFVVGDRFAGGIEKGAMSLSHRIGVRALSALGRLITGTDVRDFHCGLRGITREAIGKLDFQTGGMEFASEMIVLAVKNGLRIRQVPVPLRRCEKKRRSKLRTIPDGFRHLRFLLHR